VDGAVDDSLLCCGEVLDKQCAVMSIALSAEQRHKLLTYVELFHRCNKVYNLTAVRNMEALVSRHIIDSLSILPYLDHDKRVLDVGTGAGLPGIPLAIMRPDLRIALLDSNGKKICFLRHVVAELGLENAGAVHKRVEEYTPKKPFDIVVSRAFSSLANIVDSTAQCVAEEGCWLAMKGMYPSAEIAEISYHYNVYKLTLPGDNAQRHVVLIDRCDIK